MTEVLLFVRVDILNPTTHDRADTPRCVAIRTDTCLQPAVLQEQLIAAVHREYRSWQGGVAPAARPSLWRRWHAALQALLRPAASTRRKLPAAASARPATPLAAIGQPRRWAF